MADEKFVQFPWRNIKLFREELERASTAVDDPSLINAASDLNSLIDEANERGLKKLNSLCERFNIDPTMSEMERWAAIG